MNYLQTEREDYPKERSQRTYTDRVLSIQDLKHKSPRMILRHLKQTRPREEYASCAKIMDDRYQQYLLNKQNSKDERLKLSACKRKIAQLVNSDKRFSLDRLKKQDGVGAQKLICEFINKHKKYYNKLVVKLPSYERVAPFRVDQFSFVDKILPHSHVVEKQLGFDEENLSRNHLVLERIILERRFRRQV